MYRMLEENPEKSDCSVCGKKIPHIEIRYIAPLVYGHRLLPVCTSHLEAKEKVCL